MSSSFSFSARVNLRYKGNRVSLQSFLHHEYNGTSCIAIGGMLPKLQQFVVALHIFLYIRIIVLHDNIYYHVVLYLEIIKVWGLQRVIYQNQLKFYLFTVCQYWLVIADPKNIFRSILTHSKKLLQNF